MKLKKEAHKDMYDLATFIQIWKSHQLVLYGFNSTSKMTDAPF